MSRSQGGEKGNMDEEKTRHLTGLRNNLEKVNEKLLKTPSLEKIVHEKLEKIYKNKPVLTLVLAILFFLGVAFFESYIHVIVSDYFHKKDIKQPEEVIIKPTETLYSLKTEDAAYIQIWEPYINSQAPKKGWLIAENPYYKISINLDHSYYMIFDKLRNKDILIYNDSVKNRIDMLTASDIGFSDHNGDNSIAFASTALHDVDGLEYEIIYEDRNSGFVLIDTEGWNARGKGAGEGYDVEAEVMFGIFANKPYFINAVEVSNLQKMGLAYQNPVKDPDEIVQSWVLIDEYRYTSMKGGDNSNGDMWGPPLLYNVTPISRIERKPWHVGSAAFSKMFPEHILLGNKINGGIIFSLPHGIFRFDDSQGIYGDQLVGEFIINAEEPQKAISFNVNPVNEELFFYDFEEFNTISGYKDYMKQTCEKYGLKYPNGTLDAHNWTAKKYAYIITLTDQWYDKNKDQVSDKTWATAEEGTQDFYSYQERIWNELEKTTPIN